MTDNKEQMHRDAESLRDMAPADSLVGDVMCEIADRLDRVAESETDDDDATNALERRFAVARQAWRALALERAKLGYIPDSTEIIYAIVVGLQKEGLS